MAPPANSTTAANSSVTDRLHESHAVAFSIGNLVKLPIS